MSPAWLTSRTGCEEQIKDRRASTRKNPEKLYSYKTAHSTLGINSNSDEAGKRNCYKTQQDGGGGGLTFGVQTTAVACPALESDGVAQQT